MKTSQDPYVASDATCKGCRYYKYLGGTAETTRYCSYTLDTGKFKPLDMKCAECTYKDIGRSRRRWKKKVVW